MDREIPVKERYKKKLIGFLIVIFVIAILFAASAYIFRTLKIAKVTRSDIQSAEVKFGTMEGSFSAEATVTPISTYSNEAMTGHGVQSC